MGPLHTYTVTVDWTGADATGTASYTSYSRDHEVRVEGKPVLLATSDRRVAADVSRYRAEELFIGSVSQAQMLWFLRSAAREGIVVVGYTDVATATERVEAGGAGPFSDIVLRPRVTYAQPTGEETAARLHRDAAAANHIARTLNCQVRVQPFAPVTAVGADVG